MVIIPSSLRSLRAPSITFVASAALLLLAACSSGGGSSGGGSGSTGGGTGSSGGSGAFTPNDPFFPLQWHLRNTGQEAASGPAARAGEDLNVMGAWAQGGRGTGVRIAIIDDGLDITHPDLVANVAAGESHDYVSGGTEPSPTLSSHGTACAGLAAAVGNNNLGVTGVAMGAQLVGYNLLQSMVTVNEADAMGRGLANNHIYSNSWGATDGQGGLQPSSAVWRAAIDTGITTGRGGRGAIYTWAAGNGSPTDRSDYEGQSNYRGVIAVGALNNQGQKSSYSEEGSNLLVSAYGGEFCTTQTTVTTDVQAAPGYNDGGSPTSENINDSNYSRCFNGTSAATPEVSGVVALVLEANPSLNWRQMRWLLAHTTRRNDPGDGDWAMNGARLPVNHKYGYGVVDATAAITAARAFDAGVDLSGAQKTATASATPALAIPDNTGTAATSTVTLTGSGLAGLEFVDLNLTSDHVDFGQLTITLTSPSGTRSVLTTQHSCVQDPSNPMPIACGSMLMNGTRFGIARLMGEPADGTWTLSVQDGVAGGTGSISAWSITAYGY